MAFSSHIFNDHDAMKILALNAANFFKKDLPTTLNRFNFTEEQSAEIITWAIQNNYDIGKNQYPKFTLGLFNQPDINEFLSETKHLNFQRVAKQCKTLLQMNRALPDPTVKMKILTDSRMYASYLRKNKASLDLIKRYISRIPIFLKIYSKGIDALTIEEWVLVKEITQFYESFKNQIDAQVNKLTPRKLTPPPPPPTSPAIQNSKKKKKKQKKPIPAPHSIHESHIQTLFENIKPNLSIRIISPPDTTLLETKKDEKPSSMLTLHINLPDQDSLTIDNYPIRCAQFIADMKKELKDKNSQLQLHTSNTTLSIDYKEFDPLHALLQSGITHLQQQYRAENEAQNKQLKENEEKILALSKADLQILKQKMDAKIKQLEKTHREINVQLKFVKELSIDQKSPEKINPGQTLLNHYLHDQKQWSQLLHQTPKNNLGVIKTSVEKHQQYIEKITAYQKNLTVFYDTLKQLVQDTKLKNAADKKILEQKKFEAKLKLEQNKADKLEMIRNKKEDQTNTVIKDEKPKPKTAPPRLRHNLSAIKQYHTLLELAITHASNIAAIAVIDDQKADKGYPLSDIKFAALKYQIISCADVMRTYMKRLHGEQHHLTQKLWEDIRNTFKHTPEESISDKKTLFAASLELAGILQKQLAELPQVRCSQLPALQKNQLDSLKSIIGFHSNIDENYLPVLEESQLYRTLMNVVNGMSEAKEISSKDYVLWLKIHMIPSIQAIAAPLLPKKGVLAKHAIYPDTLEASALAYLLMCCGHPKFNVKELPQHYQTFYTISRAMYGKVGHEIQMTPEMIELIKSACEEAMRPTTLELAKVELKEQKPSSPKVPISNTHAPVFSPTSSQPGGSMSTSTSASTSSSCHAFFIPASPAAASTPNPTQEPGGADLREPKLL